MTTKTSVRGTPTDSPSTEQERLATLLQITDALSSTLNTRSALQEVLETLARRHTITQSLIVRMDDDGRQLHVEAAHGLNRPSHHIHYTLGEGVIGKVVETGKAVIVPRISREPSLVLRAGSREDAQAEEASFICVPIGFDRRVVGALGVNLKFKADRNYERSKAFYSVVASMVGQALKVQRLVAAQHKRLVNENAHLKQELRERYDFAGIVGNSGPMQRVYEQVAQVARTNTTVLLRGESGTGKELIASAIHYNSSRAKKPFVKVSCGALPDTLIESELFGYEKGAFTGADARKKGRFELAEGGTLFLDEIGDVQLSTQVKLLRVLQEREFERLGGHETLKSDVRLIAATNKDLERAIEKGSFREDLFYRLNVFPIFIPRPAPAGQRCCCFRRPFPYPSRPRHGRDIRRLATPLIRPRMLTIPITGRATRPGLLAVIEERAVLVCDGHVIHAHHLSPTLQTAEASGTVMSIALDDAVAAYEKDLLQDALKSARGNRAKAARLLRTTERIVNYKVRKLGIDWKRFKP